MYDLKDKIVVVTGASKGIGAQFVREILEEGVEVNNTESYFLINMLITATQNFILQ